MDLIIFETHCPKFSYEKMCYLSETSDANSPYLNVYILFIIELMVLFWWFSEYTTYYIDFDRKKIN